MALNNGLGEPEAIVGHEHLNSMARVSILNLPLSGQIPDNRDTGSRRQPNILSPHDGVDKPLPNSADEKNILDQYQTQDRILHFARCHLSMARPRSRRCQVQLSINTYTRRAGTHMS